MFDLARLRGLVAAAAAVLLAMGCCSLLARAAAGGRPAWLAGGDSTIEGGQDAVVGGRIAGVRQQQRRQPGSASDLGILLGSSAVGMDLDPKILDAEAGDGLPARWLSLYANGANLEDIRDLADLIFGSGLRPKLLVLGIHPGLLARSDDYLTDPTTLDLALLKGELAAGHLRMAKAELESLSAIPLNLAFPNRTRISHRLRGLVADAKRNLFAWGGMGVEALYRPDPDPWSVRLLVEDKQAEGDIDAEGRKATVRDMAEGPMREGLLGQVKDKGWSNPAAYPAGGANALAMIAAIREARARGIEVLVLLLPERSTLRATMPPESMDCVRDALRRGFGDAAPAVIDLREALPDAMFHDSLHVMNAGRKITSRKLVEALKARGKPEPAPMSGRSRDRPPIKPPGA